MGKQDFVLWAIDAMKRWFGTDDTMRAISQIITKKKSWIAPMAPLDDRIDDAAALEQWLKHGYCNISATYPRIFPIRWKNHYSVLILVSRHIGTFFDPHSGLLPKGRRRRWYAKPPTKIINRVLSNINLHVVCPKIASQREKCDTF